MMLLSRLQARFYDRMRHPEAFRAARAGGESGDLEGLRGHNYCLLVTYKRSGEPVPTPVLFGLAGGKLYFRTEPHTGKIRRLRNDPRALVGPCNWRGKPRGPLVEGEGRLLAASENEAAYAALRAN
jgi:uncharacterized protein